MPPSPGLDSSFPHHWTAAILPSRPLILPGRHYIYPAIVEEVERGALEVLVHPQLVHPKNAQPFLATCALGFRDPAAPTGVWSMPHPDWLCAVSGGYAYLIDTTQPSSFVMLPYRPVLQVLPVPNQALLLFIGHHAITAWAAHGEAWQSPRLSFEGITIDAVQATTIQGRGWDLMTDKDLPFTLDLTTGEPLTRKWRSR